MAGTILWITRWSAALTSLAGMLAWGHIYSAYKRLSEGNYKNTILAFVIFLIIAIIGVTSMTVYHFSEETPFSELEETAENLWYIFMFIAFIYSLYESSKISSFGKKIGRS